MDVEERLNLIKEVGSEVQTEEDLKKLLEEKKNFIAYDGFEPSGRIHIAQAIMRTINVNKMIRAGAKFKMLVADWHAWANNKMDGDLEKIQTTGKYFIEVWKACGMDLKGVEFVWVSDMVKDDNYWKTVMEVARHSTVKRITRCGQIMGRSENEVMQASQILYPCMQAADIFWLKADVCQLGLDQRKVNMLAREVGPTLGLWKPVVVSHHMLMGLLPPPKDAKDATERAMAMKMSKSKPASAVFMTDTEEEISKKLAKAYCPEKQVKENPVLEYYKFMIFEKFDEVTIKRSEKFGGDLTVRSYVDLESEYAAGKIHPLDLKKTCADYVNKLVEPVRQHFEKDSKAKKLKEAVESFKVTR